MVHPHLPPRVSTRSSNYLTATVVPEPRSRSMTDSLIPDVRPVACRDTMEPAVYQANYCSTTVTVGSVPALARRTERRTRRIRWLRGSSDRYSGGSGEVRFVVNHPDNRT